MGGATQPEAALVASGLSYRYPDGRAALADVSFGVAAGETVGLVGPNGAGKTTLFLALAGVLKTKPGQVCVMGLDPSISAERRVLPTRVGIVFQHSDDQLFSTTVGDDVAFGPRRLGCDRPEVRRRVRSAMELVGLGFESFKDRYTFGLSGGELRRVAIAGVLAMEPRVLVLDEPTAGLDPRGRTDLQATLTRLRDEQGIAVVFVSHDMEEVAELAERVWVIADGRTMLSGPAKEVFRRGDELRRLGLGVPPVTRLMYALRDAGLDVPSDVVTIDEAEETLVDILSESAAAEHEIPRYARDDSTGTAE